MSFDKVIKLACKPKAAPPKAKYTDQLITATYSSDGSMVDIARALSIRLREPNSIVVFKALIVLHMMIRSGSTDNVLEYLGKGDVLRLRNVNGQVWEGYHPPTNLALYAQYLDARIKGYKELKHDPVRVQAENNRQSQYEGSSGKARKLRSLTVDKGLLREVRQVQRMVDSLVLCKLYEDDLQDDCTVTALRMIVKDLLVLTQAVNEGIINMLEHYFEMVKTDAQEALSIYKAFCKQTDRVVEYLGIARKLHQLLDVPVPHLKHAPATLVKALEEYLNDPNFEQNRIEYRQNMAVPDTSARGGGGSSSPPPTAVASKPAETTKSTESSQLVSAPTPAASAPQQKVNQSIQDFFTSIENDFGGPQQPQQQQQMQMPQMNQFMAPQFMMPQQTGAPNPFRQSTMMPQMTGFPAGPFGGNGMPMMQPQPTGFMMPQQQPFMQTQATGFASPPPQQQQPWQMPQSQSQPGMLQPQLTGSNPFRASTMFPQATGFPSMPSMPNQAPSPTSSGFMGGLLPKPQSPSPMSSQTQQKPLTAQPTGSKNPFALPSDSQPKPPTPSGPSLFELSMQKQQEQMAQLMGVQPQAQGQGQGQAMGGQQQPFSFGGSGGFGQGQEKATSEPPSASKPPVGGFMSELASAFGATGFDNNPTSNAAAEASKLYGSGMYSSNLPGASNGPTSAPSQTSSFNLSSQPTGSMAFNTTGSTDFTSSSSNFLQPQPTGFGGSTMKPFKPSSNFGSTLVESLGPVSPSGSGPTSPVGNGANGANGLQPQSTGFNPFGSAFGSTSPALAQQQQPQQTGASNMQFASIYGQQNGNGQGAPMAFGAGNGNSPFGNFGSMNQR